MTSIALIVVTCVSVVNTAPSGTDGGSYTSTTTYHPPGYKQNIFLQHQYKNPLITSNQPGSDVTSSNNNHQSEILSANTFSGGDEGLSTTKTSSISSAGQSGMKTNEYNNQNSLAQSQNAASFTNNYSENTPSDVSSLQKSTTIQGSGITSNNLQHNGIQSTNSYSGNTLEGSKTQTGAFEDVISSNYQQDGALKNTNSFSDGSHDLTTTITSSPTFTGQTSKTESQYNKPTNSINEQGYATTSSNQQNKLSTYSLSNSNSDATQPQLGTFRYSEQSADSTNSQNGGTDNHLVDEISNTQYKAEKNGNKKNSKISQYDESSQINSSSQLQSFQNIMNEQQQNQDSQGFQDSGSTTSVLTQGYLEPQENTQSQNSMLTQFQHMQGNNDLEKAYYKPSQTESLSSQNSLSNEHPEETNTLLHLNQNTENGQHGLNNRIQDLNQQSEQLNQPMKDISNKNTQQTHNSQLAFSSIQDLKSDQLPQTTQMMQSQNTNNMQQALQSQQYLLPPQLVHLPTIPLAQQPQILGVSQLREGVIGNDISAQGQRYGVIPSVQVNIIPGIVYTASSGYTNNLNTS